MGKRVIGIALSAMLFGFSFPVEAQQPSRVYRIGYLSTRSDPRDEAFRQGLRESSYSEGKDTFIEYRFAKNHCL